jgi:NAD(P)-dependent dehydrogenase (short-subunit alcohol dehydrogenase family)
VQLISHSDKIEQLAQLYLLIIEKPSHNHIYHKLDISSFYCYSQEKKHTERRAMRTTQKTFLITGVSSGFGRALAVEALHAGHHVIGTLRRPEDAAAYDALDEAHAVAKIVEMTDEAAISAMTDEIEHEYGPIDILIANAGYGHEGLFEESSMSELRRQFDVNVFGTVAVIKAVLPGMRERRTGHILAITSIGGLTTSPGLSFYHGSKYALEGILESLGKEVGHLGVHVTSVEPGPFRTDWSGRSMTHSKRLISDYDEAYEPIREARRRNNGHQPGDPERAAAAMLRVINDENPPRHLVLGSAALDALAASRATFDADVTRWEDLTRSTDFPEHRQQS